MSMWWIMIIIISIGTIGHSITLYRLIRDRESIYRIIFSFLIVFMHVFAINIVYRIKIAKDMIQEITIDGVKYNESGFREGKDHFNREEIIVLKINSNGDTLKIDSIMLSHKEIYKSFKP